MMLALLDFIRPFEAQAGLAIVVLMLIGFLRERQPASVVALTGAVAFLPLNALTTREALLAIANPAPVTIAAMFVLSAALARTGVIGTLAARLERWAGVPPCWRRWRCSRP